MKREGPRGVGLTAKMEGVAGGGGGAKMGGHK